VRYRLNISAAEEAVGFLLGIMQAAKPARRRGGTLVRTEPRTKPA
jgi:hypothetical protein